MSNKRYSDVAPNRGDKDGCTPIKGPSGKSSPKSADFKQHPHHTGPEAKGPGKIPKAK